MTPAKTPGDHWKKLQKETEGIAEPAFKHEYQSKIGSMMFLANSTKPDISFATCYAARYASNPGQEQMDATDQIYPYIVEDPEQGIVYSKSVGLDLILISRNRSTWRLWTL